jgi:hypothetical protein
MMTFDKAFVNKAAVREAVANIPRFVEIGKMTEEMRIIYLDINMHADAMVGYASWYTREKVPRVSTVAFLPSSIWRRIEKLESGCKSDDDRRNLNAVKELAGFVEGLTSLMFLKG